MKTIAATERVFRIAELVEMIALYLDFHDIHRFQQIDRFCNLVVVESRRLQKTQWLVPESSKENDPHFDKTNPSAIWRLQYLSGHDFLNTFKVLTMHLLHSQMTPEDIRTFTGLHYRASEHLSHVKRRLITHNIRWPRPHGVIHSGCQVCSGAHKDFQWSNIHPLFHFLEHSKICIAGEGDMLLLNIGLWFGYGQLPRPRGDVVEGRVDDLLALTRKIKVLYYTMWIYALDDQQFIRPACTRLVVTDGQWCYHATSETGVTVKDALRLIAVSCRTTASMGDTWMRELLSEVDGFVAPDGNGEVQNGERWFAASEEVGRLLQGDIVNWSNFDEMVEDGA